MPNLTELPNPTTADEIRQLTSAAKTAFKTYSSLPAEDRAKFLERIAERLEELGDVLLQTANAETFLPLPRLTGERGRTCAQLRMFAKLIRSTDWLDLRIETADPARTPLPKPDLRRTQVALGPVVVFGASNFPLAFSVPGGDTASALAAGCPVICKAHPSHPETSRLCAEAILGAVEDCGLPTGTFGIVWGGVEVGQALVQDPNVYAVGFTGSLRAGRALFDLAARRERPIPVYAEMGSVNPVFLMPGALETRLPAVAKGYADSLTMGVGQFCTNPGVVVGLEGAEFDLFLETVAGHLAAVPEGKMLNTGIASTYAKGVVSLTEKSEVTTLVRGEGASAALFAVTGDQFLADPHLREELFGPAAVAVRCSSLAQMVEVAEVLEGQLTSTVHFDASDYESVKELLPALTHGSGRLVANAFPTGVEVNSAMQHGGPYPATTDSRSTSVGTAAILRFVRPVAFQDFPTELLPSELR